MEYSCKEERDNKMLNVVANKIPFFIVKENLILFVLILIGLYLRTYQSLEWLNYGHDQDLAGWIVRDIVEGKHLRLIGQETSTQGIFIGPIFYYLLAFFYVLFDMSPVGGMWMMTIIGLLTIYSIYYVFSDLFNKSAGLWAAFFYSVSYLLVFNDRGVFPTSPMILWCIWYFFGLKKLIDGKYFLGFVITGFLTGLTWHIHVSLALLSPLILVSLFFARSKKFGFKEMSAGIFTFFLTASPFFLFEIRHNFIQTRSLLNAFGSDQGSAYDGLDQLYRVLYISAQNITYLVWRPDSSFYYVLPLFLIVASVYLSIKKVLDKKILLIFFIWNFLLVLFFSTYSKTVSEYYLNGLLLPWVVIIVLLINHIWENKKIRFLSIILVSAFVFENFFQLYRFKPAGIEYLTKLSLVREIKKDAAERGYPCVAVSYITDPGYDLGYRYLFWLEDMHVNKPREDIPVYTIVFPLKDIFPTNKNFGSLGLIYPDYDKYDQQKIFQGCNGPNENLTDTMFGYTN